MTDDVLLDALDRLRGTGPEFDGFLANHGPMAADALTRIGGATTVPAWVDAYRPRLGDAPGVVRGLDADAWREHLGDARLIGDWTELMRREARDRPWPDLLVRWWPRLLSGMAASATHGLIRTAHAVRVLRAAGDDPHPLLVDELAQGLALWAARYQRVPGAPRLAGPDGAIGALSSLPRLDPSVPDAGPGIGGRLAVLGGLAALPTALDRWGAGDADAALDDLVSAAARVLAARDDAPIAFCHAVTGPAALRLVLPVLPGRLHRPSIAMAWQVVGAIVSAFASPRMAAESRAVHDGRADDLAALAVAHGDEHVVKLTEAVLREHVRTADPTLLVAARRFRERIRRPG